jgi:RNA polymerase sigma factor (sigma-70 family)
MEIEMADSEMRNGVCVVPADRIRAGRILGLEIKFIESDEFESMLGAISGYSRLESVPQSDSRMSPDMAEVSADHSRLEGDSLFCFAEEQHEFRRMNFLKFQACRLQATLDPECPNPDVMDRIEQLLGDAKRSRDEIVQAHLGLVYSNVQKFCKCSNDFDDLVSDGSVALLAAVESFNYRLGFRFSTYATHSICRSFFRKHERRQKHRKQFAVTDPEMMKSTPDREQVGFRFPSQVRVMSQISRLFSDHLTDRERRVIEGRFGLNEKNETQTLLQLSGILGICKERVRQVEQIALAKLAAIAGEHSELVDLVELAL